MIRVVVRIIIILRLKLFYFTSTEASVVLCKVWKWTLKMLSSYFVWLPVAFHVQVDVVHERSTLHCMIEYQLIFSGITYITVAVVKLL